MPIEFVDLAAAEAAMEREGELHSLPELFVENTRFHPHMLPALRRRARELAAPRWREVLRQSCKTYASSPRVALPPGALATLLAGARDAGSAIPDPGALHPLELYLLVVKSREVPAGLYHYNAGLGVLERLEALEADDAARALATLLADPDEGRRAEAAVLTTAVPIRLCVLYGDRGYRMLLAEAGRAAERLHAGARALGRELRPVHTFYDRRVDTLLQVDGVDEFAAGLALLHEPVPG